MWLGSGRADLTPRRSARGAREGLLNVQVGEGEEGAGTVPQQQARALDVLRPVRDQHRAQGTAPTLAEANLAAPEGALGWGLGSGHAPDQALSELSGFRCSFGPCRWGMGLSLAGRSSRTLKTECALNSGDSSRRNGLRWAEGLGPT